MENDHGAYCYTLRPGECTVSYQPFSRRSKVTVMDPDQLSTDYMDNKRPIQFENNAHKDKFSIASARKMKQRIQILTAVVPKPKYFKGPLQMTGRLCLAFATFTLASSQVHSDQLIKHEILNPFLKCVQRRYGIISYIWRAEKQANGNLHLHIIWDRYIAWAILVKTWNYFQNKLGYVDRYSINQKEFYKNGFRLRSGWSNCNTAEKQKIAYLKGKACGWCSPPSVNVQSLKTVISIISYLTKYMMKPSDAGSVSGRLWGCSSNLVNAKGSQGFAEGSVADELSTLEKMSGSTVYKGDYYYVIHFNPKLLTPGLFPLLASDWLSWAVAHFPIYFPPDLINT